MNDNRWITISDAALVLGKSKRTLHRLIRLKDLDTAQQGRETIVNLRALWRAADSMQRGGTRPHVAIDNQSQMS